jgi:hypothetical protein
VKLKILAEMVFPLLVEYNSRSKEEGEYAEAFRYVEEEW